MRKTVIVLLIAIIVTVPLGIVIANEHAEKYCYVIFRRQIILAEDVVFDDGYGTSFHDGPLYTTKGTPIILLMKQIIMQTIPTRNLFTLFSRRVMENL